MYYLFLDESGDHGLNDLDPNFPVFILCGVLVYDADYTKIRDSINIIKNKLWGNKEVIFHSRDIRKCNKEFQILFDIDVKSDFYNSLNDIISGGNYVVFASAINKQDYIHHYGKLGNDVYETALSFIIERAVFYLDDIIEDKKSLQVVIEKRGKKEDKKLNEHCQRILARGTGYVSSQRLQTLNLKFNFRSKSLNINGLQLADLIAYPIARYVIDKKRANPAFDLIQKKIYNKMGKQYGLKIFP